ncbi:ABC transporter permease subunit [Virgisporangium ochraceum]
MNAVNCEWTKLRTSPGTVWLALAVVVTTAGVSLLAAVATRCADGTCAFDPAKVSLTGVAVGQAVVAVLVELAVGTEYSSGTMRLTLAAVPRRTHVLAAKAVVLAAIVGAAAVPSTLLSLWAGRAYLDDPPDLGSGAVLRAAVGSVLYLVLVALLSLGLATVTRNSATAIGAVLALLYVVPILATAVRDADLEKHLKQLGPMNAGLAVQATRGLDELPIGPWKGLGVLCLWAVGALVLAAVLLTRRDA